MPVFFRRVLDEFLKALCSCLESFLSWGHLPSDSKHWSSVSIALKLYSSFFSPPASFPLLLALSLLSSPLSFALIPFSHAQRTLIKVTLKG